jgi:nucleotide-binding universal stress UspA family protein
MSTDNATHQVTHAKHILVALDGSATSEAALDQGVQLAKTFGSTVYLIHVLDMYAESMSVAANMEEKLSQEAREILREGKARVEAEDVNCGDTIVHMGGQPHAFITREAEQRDVDLIVLGSHGRTGLRKLLMGSVAERVIGHAPCPVLVVPD